MLLLCRAKLPVAATFVCKHVAVVSSFSCCLVGTRSVHRPRLRPPLTPRLNSYWTTITLECRSCDDVQQATVLTVTAAEQVPPWGGQSQTWVLTTWSILCLKVQLWSCLTPLCWPALSKYHLVFKSQTFQFSRYQPALAFKHYEITIVCFSLHLVSNQYCFHLQTWFS